MSIRRLIICLSSVFLAVAMIGIAFRSQLSSAGTTQPPTIIAGRNINMVSGTKLPFGDPWLQRQNEPSIAASTRNPMHILGGGNDYRTIDMPENINLPGIERAAAADAWLGVYESFDGGESWISTLLPGFPQDASSQGQLSPISGYETACDPIVRAGANGLFYYCGIAFNHDKKKSAIFIARYVDDNNLEKVELTTAPNGTPQYSGPIQYIDTRLVATGSTTSSFIDMPNMAVDIPRGSARYGTIYVAYTVFSSTPPSGTVDKIFLQRSTDGGVTWSTPSTPPVQLSTTGDIVQRPIIAVDPTDLKGNTVYVAFRRFARGTVPDGIAVVRSTDGGKTFSRLPDPAPSFYPFDQSTSPSHESFRTNSYPTIAVGDLGTVYVAWSQRQGGPSGQARIVISALRKGSLLWTPPQVVDGTYSGSGHQFMPSLAFAAWKLMLAWYDQRNDVVLDGLQFIGDTQGMTRHTIDVRAAEGTPGLPPKFSPSVQLSRYLYVLDLDANGNPIPDGSYYKVLQAEFNHINYPLFQLGTVPFHGDYLDVTPSVKILPPAIAFGSWIYNINPLEPTSFHAAWTDNRDVRPPNGDMWGNWVSYSAPTSDQIGWVYPPPPTCADGSKTGMRNQNIYTAHINKGLVMGSPGNTKQLNLPMTGDGGRTFVVFVKDTTGTARTLNLVLLEIGGVNASFDQFQNDNRLQVNLQPYSSASCTVYVDRSTRPLAPVVVNAFEGLKLVGYVVLNPDPTNLPLDLGNETHNPDVGAPVVWNYDLGTTIDPNAAAMLNPRVQNPRVQNDSIVNPRVQNEGVTNPRVQNESIVNSEVPNPRVQNTAAPNAALTDVTWTVTNEGNTTSVFTTNIRSQHPEYFTGDNPPLIAQVLVYKVHRVPVDKDCLLYETHQDELIADISNPRVQNPRVQNSPVTNSAVSALATTQAADLGAQDITFYLAPGEQAEVTLRVWDQDTTDGSPTFSPDLVIVEAVAEAVNTVDVEQGGTTPPSDVPPNSEPWHTALPQFSSDQASLSFTAYPGYTPPAQTLTITNSGAGTLSYSVTSDASWLSVTPSNCPSGCGPLQVSVSILGLTAGTYNGTLIFNDPVAANNPFRVPVTLVLQPAPPLLFIATTSIADGIKGTDYGASFQFTGGLPPVNWSILTGALPPGLVLNPTTGSITGSPTSSGFFNFTVQARDAFNQTVSVTLSMTIADWVTKYDSGGGFNDVCQAMAVDAAGNVYVTGFKITSTAGAADWVTRKYNSSGDVLWTTPFHVDGTTGGGANALAVDAWGNVYVTGYYSFAAGASVEPLTVKYNSSGVQQWTARHSGWEEGDAIAVDAMGNVYVTGQAWAPLTGIDYGTIKYNNAGVEQWAATYDAGIGSGIDYPKAIAVDPMGNVYVTGTSRGTTGNDITTVKYDGSGAQKWVNRYLGTGIGDDYGEAIAVDSSGNIYVAGSSVTSHTGKGTSDDYTTIKYDSSGAQKWAATYNGPANGSDSALAIAVDLAGNVYVSGYSAGVGTSGDYATVKYDNSGVEQWVARYDNPNHGIDAAKSIACDGLGNVYVAGYSGISAASSYDATTIKYSGTGSQQWVARYDGPDHLFDWASSVALDPLGNIYVSGISNGTLPAEDFVTIRYVQSFPSTLVITTGALDHGLANSAYAKALWAFGGSGNRTWSTTDGSLPPGLDLSSPTGIIAGTPTSPGKYNFTVQVVDGSLIATKSLSITIGEVYELVGTFGGPGTGDGQFGVPFGIAVDPSGNVYVSDDGNHRIQKFDSNGTFLGWWGLDNLGNTGWHNPGSGRTGVLGTGDGQFNRPLGVAIDSGGMVYVTDTQNLRVQKFDSTGTYLTQWNGGDAGFSWPIGIAADTSGFVYICDTFRDRVWIFTSSGNYQSTLSVAYQPRGIAFDPSESCFYVTDKGDAPWQNVAIKKYKSNWEPVLTWGNSGSLGSFGSGDYQFNEIGYPAVSNTGHLYVPDSMNNRVQVFSLDGKLLAKIGGTPGWGSPWGIAVNNSLGYIYITDQYNTQVQIWRKIG